MPNPFETLGIPENSTEKQILKAWRELALKHHPDKQSCTEKNESTEDHAAKMKELNAAKDACIETIFAREYTVDELEFARFVARKVEKSIERGTGLKLDLHDGELIKGYLHSFMRLHAIDAMEWVLRVVTQEWEFEQEMEDEIPVLCKFYNDFVGRDNWEEDDHTMMMVLNKYDQIKTGGYGGFGRRIEDQ